MTSNKEVATRWLEAVGGGDAEAFRALMTEDASWKLMGTSVLAGDRTVDEVAELASQLFAATKNGITFEILAVTAEDDRVALECTGSSDLVNGTAYDNVYHLLFRLRDGKICSVKEYCDSKIIDAAIGPLLAEAG